jgi:hypothetical protein
MCAHNTQIRWKKMENIGKIVYQSLNCQLFNYIFGDQLLVPTYKGKMFQYIFPIILNCKNNAEFDSIFSSLAKS